MAHVVKSLFGKPRCSECNGVVYKTGYAFPFPQWRCPNCYSRNKERESLQKQINDLKKLVQDKHFKP